MTDLSAWIDREEHREDTITLRPAALLSATLDLNLQLSTGDELPALWHWLYFPPDARRPDLGIDGHPRRGGFFPPLSERRRMFAGARIELGEPLRIGDDVRRVGTIRRIERKEGRRGPLVIVTVRYVLSGAERPVVIEEQDLVYTDAPPVDDDDGTGDVPSAPWAEEVATDESLLFRFSAVTFNAHRIHYDAPYAERIEGYRRPVVHGPLVALLLAGLAERRSGRRLRAFSFRARSPALVGDALLLRGHPGAERAQLAAYGPSGSLRMDASADLRIE